MRRLSSVIAAAVVLAAANDTLAQGLSESNLRVAPQMVSYNIGSEGAKTSISELAIPLAFVMPFTSRLSFDIATAFATSTVEPDGGEKSTLSGLTDTQLRLNYTFGTDAVVVTAGLNLPSGQYEVDPDKAAAASAIGNDFLAFPISSFGNGLGGTGGIAVARSAGEWNIGLAGSFRKSTEFGAYKLDDAALRFLPADEIRLRAGVDRFVGSGRLMFGLVYSMFGDDTCEGCESGTSRTTYSTGNRLIGQAAFDVPVGGAQLFLAGWFLQRAEGMTVAGTAPGEMILNAQAALGLTLGTFFLEPSVEIRRWTIDGESAGSLVSAGARTQFNMGALYVSPSAAFVTGSYGVEGVDLSGFKIGATIRLGN
jgi:hypothetical protein